MCTSYNSPAELMDPIFNNFFIISISLYLANKSIFANPFYIFMKMPYVTQMGMTIVL